MNHTRTLGLAAVAAIGMAGAAFAEGVVAGETAEGSLAGKTLTFVSYGGIYQDGQIKALQDFVTKSGATLLSDGPTENAKIQAQVEAKNVMWDVVDTGDFTPFVHCGTLFQKLDFTKIDVSKIPPGQVGECSVAHTIGGFQSTQRRTECIVVNGLLLPLRPLLAAPRHRATPTRSSSCKCRLRPVVPPTSSLASLQILWAVHWARA